MASSEYCPACQQPLFRMTGRQVGCAFCDYRREDPPENPDAWREKQAEIMLSDATSYWLKGALAELTRRDPLDALRDAEILHDILQGRWEDLMKRVELDTPCKSS